MRRACPISLIVLLAALLLAPSGAMAKDKRHAPPGNSGVDEYTEVVPGGGGNRPVGRLHRGNGSALSGKTRGELRGYGADGRRAAKLAELTGSSDASSGGRGDRGSAKRGRDQTPASEAAFRQRAADSDGGVLAAIKRVFSGIGDGGMGGLFPALLLVTLAGAAVLGLRRRTRRSAE